MSSVINDYVMTIIEVVWDYIKTLFGLQVWIWLTDIEKSGRWKSMLANNSLLKQMDLLTPRGNKIL